MADDLTVPGRFRRMWISRRKVPLLSALLVAVGGLMVAAVVFVLVVDDPQGGEPVAIAPIEAAAASQPVGDRGVAVVPMRRTLGEETSGRGAGAERGHQMPPADIVITDHVTLPAGAQGTQLVEPGAHGLLPVIAPDGQRAADVFAAEAPPLAADVPRIAILVGGMGVSTTLTEEAIRRLPGAVTLAFAPYGSEIDRLSSRARQAGHELLLQVPLEPFDFPDNDPGPQTLLTGLSEEQNRDRLHWAMSRFTGYVGVTNYMGGRFTTSEAALRPLLGELRERGLIYADDGSSPRSVAGELARRMDLPSVTGDIIIDANPTRSAIQDALAELEDLAHERGHALGVASGLPAGIEEIAEWIATLESKGLVLVPVTALVADRES